MPGLLSAIRNAIETSGQTRYQIAKGSGVSQAQLSRLVSGEQGMSIANVEKLAKYLNLEVVIRPKRRPKGASR